MKSPNIVVTFLAVSYFNSGELPRLIQSLIGQDDARWRLLIVDNSCDSSEQSRLTNLAEIDPRIRVLISDRNYGFFPGALTHANQVENSQWVAICNSDTELSCKDFVSRLSLVGEESSAVIAPSIKESEPGLDLNPFLLRPPSQLWILLRLAGTSHSTLFRLMQKIRDARTKQKAAMVDRQSGSLDIFASHGSFMVLRADFFSTLRPKHFQKLYGEELTIAMLVRYAKGKITYFPSLAVRHYAHASTSSVNLDLKARLQHKALRSFARTYRSRTWRSKHE